MPCEVYQYLTNSYIGISDPGADSAIGYHQAYLRALSMVALNNGSGKGMSDFFNEENENHTLSKYEELCELKASCNLPILAIKVLNTLRLKSGELVLFLAIDSSAVKSEERVNLKYSIEWYSKEIDNDGHHQIISKTKLENESSYSNQVEGHKEILTNMMSNNRWLSKETLFDNRIIDNNRTKLFYEPSGGCEKDTIGCLGIGTETLDGLWYALANSMYRQLSVHLKEHFLKVINVGDRFDDQTINLNRESGFFRFRCNLNDFLFFKNKLYTQITTKFSGNPESTN